MKTKSANQNQPLPAPLTAKEKSVMEFIELRILEDGISPSYQEIKEHFGFASYNSVQNYLKQLMQKGYIHLAAHQKRAIQVLQPSQSVRSAIQNKVELTKTQKTKSPERPELLLGSREILSIPLLGRVAAGRPIEAMEHNESVEVPPSLIRNPDKSFALKVQGESMIEDGIFDGDIILVQKQPHANNGEIVVASVENEATVKRFFVKATGAEKQIELRPANSTMQSMWFHPQQVNIQGVVVGLIRRF